MATKQPARQKAVKPQPGAAPRSALGKALAANQAALARRQAQAGYLLGLTNTLGRLHQERGVLTTVKATQATRKQLEAVDAALAEAYAALTRWTRNFVENKL